MPKNSPGGKEVHGGLPLCWPWFGKREGMPKHGLVRYLKWSFVRRIGKDAVVLKASSTPETMKVWPHEFKVSVTISVDGPDGMKIEFKETNTGKIAYESAFGIHPYFSVADACKVSCDGRKLGKPWVIEEFPADGKTHMLEDVVDKRVYSVESSSNDTWCLWNPGVERTALCETLASDEWRKFWCIEPFMRNAKPLEPGQSRTIVIRLKAFPLQ